MGSVLVALPRHAGEPADAWPAGARDLIPGPAAFYGTFAAVFLPFAAGALLLISRLRDRHEVPGTARWARPRDLRALRVPTNRTGRLILGRAAGRLVAAESRQSAIVIGPTQTGKTTGFAIPAILEWKGPVVATSIKTDLLRETIAARSAIAGARTFVYDPTGSTGLPSDGWTPLIEGLTWQGAQRVAEWLARGARTSGMASDTADFWYGATAKLLAPDPPRRGLQRRLDGTGGRLGRLHGRQPPERALKRTTNRRPSTRSRPSHTGTTEQEEASTRPHRPCSTPTSIPASSPPRCQPISAPNRLLDGGSHTAYLCAPAHEQRRLRPLFATLVQEIIAHVVWPCGRNGKAARPAAPPRPRRVRQHRAPAGPGDARSHGRRPGHTARVGLPGHRSDLRGLRARPRPDDRVEPPSQGDPLGDLRSADARIRRATPRRRAGLVHLLDIGNARALHDGVRQLSPSRASERSSRDATRPRRSRLRPPRPDADHSPALVQGSAAQAARSAANRACPSGGTVSIILDDLTTLSPKRLEKHLEALARDALACSSVTILDGNPEDGLTVSLRVDSRRRADVLDLARVVEDDGIVSASCSWSALAPSRRHPEWRLLLRVGFERPGRVFVHGPICGHQPHRRRRFEPASRFSLRLIGSSSTSTAGSSPSLPVVWIAAPSARDCVLDVLAETRL